MSIQHFNFVFPKYSKFWYKYRKWYHNLYKAFEVSGYNERMNEWMNEWIFFQLLYWAHSGASSYNSWMNEWMNEWRMNEWMKNEWMNEWMKEWMNEWMNESVYLLRMTHLVKWLIYHEALINHFIQIGWRHLFWSVQYAITVLMLMVNYLIVHCCW